MPRVHYISAYEKSKDQLAKEAREREHQKTDLFSGICPYTLKYHYQLNINNTVINAFYEDTIRRHKLGHPPFSDNQRVEWERCLWKFLRKQYMQYDRKSALEIPKELSQTDHMSRILFGWRHEYFELYINNVLDIPSALKLFAREEAKVDYGKCGDKEVLRV